jgi:hypothetical protein
MLSWRRYAAFALISQAFNSATNLVLVLLLARSLGRHEFGVQALSLVMLPLTLAAFRGFALEPAVVHGSGLNLRRFVAVDALRAAAACVLATLAVEVIAGGSLVLGALLACGSALAILEDAARWLLAREDRPDLAALADIGWAIAQGSIVAIALNSPVCAMAAWTVGGAVSVVIAWLGLSKLHRKSRLSVGGAEDSKASTRVARRWNWGLEHLAAMSAPQLVLLVAPLTGGVGVTGSISAAMSLTGVSTVITGAAHPAIASRLHRVESPRQLVHWAITIGAALGLIALVFSSPLLFIPDGAGVQLLGKTWSSARLVLPAILVHKVAASAALGPIFVTRRVKTYSLGLWLRLPLTVATVALAAVAAALAGAQGAAVVLAFFSVASLFLWGGVVRHLASRNGLAVASATLRN